MDVTQIEDAVSIVTLVGGMAGMFFGLRTQVRVLETQVERLEKRIGRMEQHNESMLSELRSDIKDLLVNR